MEKFDHSYFKNTDCEYFPCHAADGEGYFNCLFCYCPLYALGEECGGNFTYTDSGIKDCSACMIPHSKGGYGYVIDRYGLVKALAEKKR